MNKISFNEFVAEEQKAQHQLDFEDDNRREAREHELDRLEAEEAEMENE